MSIPLFQLKYALVYHRDNNEIHENITVDEWAKKQRLGWVSFGDGGGSVTSGLEEILARRDLNMIYKSNSVINMLLSVASNTSLSMVAPTFLLPALSRVIPIKWCEPRFLHTNLPYMHAHFHKSQRRDQAIAGLVRIMQTS